jgi:hypothetical protein
MSSTRTPMASARPSSPSNGEIGSDCSTTSRRRYGLPSGPRVDSALAMFETATSMRARCASSAVALAAMALERGMCYLPSLMA